MAAAPQPNLVTSMSDRVKRGIGRNYVDAYNQLQMAQYNNAYNYWLWQQQAEYNSPSNQVQRLREAGLNPNFNSIEGTGNLGSMPTSSGSITPSIGRNRAATVGNIISSVNALIGGIGEGVDSLSKLKDIPTLDALQDYRKMLSNIIHLEGYGKELKNMNLLFDTLLKGEFAGVDTSGIVGFNYPMGVITGDKSPDIMFYDPEYGVSLKSAQQKLKNLGLDYDIKELVKAAKSFYNERIQPNEAAKSQGAAGMAALGRFIQKIDNGESMSWRDWIAFILAAASMKFL